ncbi:MAG: NPCBM/NEW2 domain-containing protein [Planctomycetota bacterium]
MHLNRGRRRKFVPDPGLTLFFFVAAELVPATELRAEAVPLTALELSKVRQGWGKPQVDRSVVGKPLSIGGRAFERGLGSHATMVLHVALDGKTERLSAFVGVDDETEGRGSVRFLVYGDGKKLFDSGVLRGGDAAKPVDVDLREVRKLVLLAHPAGDGIDYDHADWAEAAFWVAGDRPAAVDAPPEEAVILTPKPGPEPRLNGPKVYGCRPGRPFLYRIPATGERPMEFSAEGLPAGIRLDPEAGILAGSAPKEKGEHRVELRAKNRHGAATRPFRIVVGDTLALTPPMGWNSWYIHYHRVSDRTMRAAADAMVASGMADFGYSYVNIDDCWMVKVGSNDPELGGDPRDAGGAVRPNGKFPDMKALADYIHAKGLKAGLYISPGPRTCGGYVGSYGHEETDARKFAAWGFDFLKYDWCSYGEIDRGDTLEGLKKPYRLMGEILKGLDRDIVFNLCQYGMGDVWKWGAEVDGNCWRTTGDLGLEGGQLSLGIYQVGLKNATLSEYARPGAWNDPDYILIGWVGDASVGGEGRPTTLTPNEQYTHMSMWCLMAAPLIFSGDMERLDPFTLNILCNAEVIDVDQDPLGKQASIARQDEDELVLAKPLEDGSLAVGLFNLSEFERTVAVSWKELGIEGARRVRDLWRQKDLGALDSSYTAAIGRHGVSLVRIFPHAR